MISNPIPIHSAISTAIMPPLRIEIPQTASPTADDIELGINPMHYFSDIESKASGYSTDGEDNEWPGTLMEEDESSAAIGELMSHGRRERSHVTVSSIFFLTDFACDLFYTDVQQLEQRNRPILTYRSLSSLLNSARHHFTTANHYDASSSVQSIREASQGDTSSFPTAVTASTFSTGLSMRSEEPEEPDIGSIQAQLLSIDLGRHRSVSVLTEDDDDDDDDSSVKENVEV